MTETPRRGLRGGAPREKPASCLVREVFSAACRGLAVVRYATDFSGAAGGDRYTRYDTVMSGAGFAATLKPASAQTFVVEGCSAP